MIRRPILLSAAAFAIVLTGCKGSGSNPTPTPTPTTTPTPTPTPISYSTLPLTAATEFFASSAATTYTGVLATGPVTLGAAGTDSQSSRVRLALSTDATTSTSLFVVHENTEESRYAPANVVTAPDPAVTEYSFRDTTTTAGLTTMAEFLNNTIATKVTTDAGLALTSVSYATWIRDDTTVTPNAHRLTSTVWGYNTANADMPTTGTATYSARIAGRVIQVNGAGTGTLTRLGGTAAISVNFATGLVSYTLNVTTITGGVETAYGTFTGTGAIGVGNNQFTGSFGAASPIPGTVTGAFFGAQGKEIGITFAGIGTVGGFDTRAIAAVVGKKN